MGRHVGWGVSAVVFSAVGNSRYGRVRLMKFKGYPFSFLLIYPFLPASLLTATMRVNSAEKSLDTTAFVASWMVAVEVENNVGVSFLTIDGCFKVTRR